MDGYMCECVRAQQKILLTHFALPWSALDPDCLLSLKRARRLPTAASKGPCFDPPARSD